MSARGGKRPGAGRPKGSKPDSRVHQLTQRYSNAELHDIEAALPASGCASIGEFIREIVTGHCWQPTRGGKL